MVQSTIDPRGRIWTTNFTIPSHHPSALSLTHAPEHFKQTRSAFLQITHPPAQPMPSHRAIFNSRGSAE
jgi:hypothetical protein